jgi:sugar lactone lactonase YvrE
MNIRLTLVTVLAVCTALWAMPGTARGQMFASVNSNPYSNGGSNIYQYNPTGSYTTFLSNLDHPRGLAFDSAGNLFVGTFTWAFDGNGDPAGFSEAAVLKVSSGGVASTFVTFPGVGSEGLATDSAGNLFVASFNTLVDPTDSIIYKVTPDGTVSTFGHVPGQCFGLRFDSAGNLFAAGASDSTNTYGSIYEFTPGGVRSVFVGPEAFSSTQFPNDLAFDSAGNLFVSTENNLGNDSILEFTPSGTGSTFATGLANNPRGLAFDSAGNLFVAEPGFGCCNVGDILKFTPQGAQTVFASQGFGTHGNRGPEFLAFPGAVTPTPPSTAVVLTFPDSTEPLTTTVVESVDQGSVPPPPSNFQLTGSNLAFDITTTTEPTPPIILAFTVSPAVYASGLAVLHYECDTQNPPVCSWVDRTIHSGDPNYPSNPAPYTIYGSVDSLSPFLIAQTLPPSLGAASNYTVFALTGPKSGGKQTANFSSGTDYGNVAVAAGATLQLQAPSTINGNLYVASGASVSGPGKVNGTRYTNQNLSAARSDALSASAQAAALASNVTFTNVTANQTVNGISGVNVVKITGSINLNNASLTLNGPSDAYFVVNVAGSITLGGSGGIVVGGGMPGSHLLINMTGSGSNLLNTHIGNVIQGTLLGPNAGGTLEGSAGAVILGQNCSLMTVTLRHP